MESHDKEDEVQDAEDLDPTEVLTMEDMVAKYEILEEIWLQKNSKANIDEEALTVSRRRHQQSGPRRYIPRNREAGHEDLFAKFPKIKI